MVRLRIEGASMCGALRLQHVAARWEFADSVLTQAKGNGHLVDRQIDSEFR